MVRYAPLINDTIPAFMNKIKIPFQMNPAVSQAQVHNIILQVKDYQTSKVICRISSQEINYEKGEVIFPQTEKDYEINKVTYHFPEVNQYYKVQIAYNDDSTLTEDNYNKLIYSSASIIKCISKGFDGVLCDYNEKIVYQGDENCEKYKFIYIREPDADLLYSYRYELRDESCVEVIESCEEQLWDSRSDIEIIENNKITSVKSVIDFKISSQLNFNKEYNIYFYITTINGFQESWPFTICGNLSISNTYNISLVAAADNEEGCIDLKFNDNYQISNINGQFILDRNNTKYPDVWEELATFAIGTSNDLSKWSYKDYFVEHNNSYIYRLRQFNNGKFAIGTKTLPVIVKFEDMFLSDKDRQLKIRFNPKVSSFKSTILESKMETIGGQYPYFFRNSQVNYKEIPISGLISYLADDNQSFINHKNIGINENNLKTTNLVNYNIAAEKEFKLEVLKWLNNGKPKLFRSSTEGNYIIRLMNVSLSPEEQLGRMLHSFSATGYEIAPPTLDKANETNIINTKQIKEQLETVYYDLSYQKLEALYPEFIIENKNIQNIEWNYSWPIEESDPLQYSIYVENEKIYGDSKNYYYYHELFNPTGQKMTLNQNSPYTYVEFYIPTSSHIKFEDTTPQYISTTDNFGKGNYNSYWEIVDYQEENTLTNLKDFAIHYIQVSGTGTIQIGSNGENIQLKENEPLYFYEVCVDQIKYTNAQFTMYYTIEE